MAGSARFPGPDVGAGRLRHLAVRGAVVVGLRGVAARFVALAGTVVVARTLSTEDFGFFALSTILLTCIVSVVQAGLGAGLIRRPFDPTRAELQTVVAANGVLLIASVAVTCTVCAILGGKALAVALIVASLPITAFRGPGLIMFERALNYRPLAQIELFETTALYGLSAVFVLAGLGLSGVAIAAAVRTMAGTFLMIRASSQGLIQPRLSSRIVRDLARFAGVYQGTAVVSFVRDQGINLAITTIGGIAMLGVYSVASNVLQAPRVVLEALFRVSFPAMARLNERGENARIVVERTLKAVALGLGLVVAPLSAASVPLIPLVFGERWSDAAVVVPPVSLGLVVAGPVAVAAAGYLFAVDAGAVVMRSALLHTVAWFLVALPLLKPLGVAAAGLGLLATSLVEGLVLGWAVHRRTGARILKALVVPSLAATAAAAAGAGALALTPLDRIAGVATAGAVSIGVYAVIVVLFQRDHLANMTRLVRGAASSSGDVG